MIILTSLYSSYYSVASEILYSESGDMRIGNLQ